MAAAGFHCDGSGSSVPEGPTLKTTTLSTRSSLEQPKRPLMQSLLLRAQGAAHANSFRFLCNFRAQLFKKALIRSFNGCKCCIVYFFGVFYILLIFCFFLQVRFYVL